jgi:biopolymer transport protein ExbD
VAPTRRNSRHGISVSVYNTAFGLIVAIPSMVFYRTCRARSTPTWWTWSSRPSTSSIHQPGPRRRLRRSATAKHRRGRVCDFHRGLRKEEPEINLIPLIDVLLVIVIFLAVSTTYSHFAELEITLPRARAPMPVQQKPVELDIAVNERGEYFLNRRALDARDAGGLSAAMRDAAGSEKDPVIVIVPTPRPLRQSVINVMEAARQAGYVRITFATERRSRGSRGMRAGFSQQRSLTPFVQLRIAV